MTILKKTWVYLTVFSELKAVMKGCKDINYRKWPPCLNSSFAAVGLVSDTKARLYSGILV